MQQTYASKIRQTLHMYPEVGFDLPLTLGLIRGELDRLGVEYTEKYGRSSIVATVNPHLSGHTLAIRADIDALPITEQNDVPYRSRHEGRMHACGHDAHTAIALDALRRIYSIRDTLGCRIRFIFQSAEEYTVSGAKLMAEDGVMEDVDAIVALHCSPDREAGYIGLSSGEQNAISHGFKLNFYGESAHVANQEKGKDAIMMAVRAYTDLEFMAAKHFCAKEPFILNVGAIHGGVTNNVIADSCELFCTLRAWSDRVAEDAIENIKRIANAAAETLGGRAEYTVCKHYPIVRNDPELTELMRRVAVDVVGGDKVYANRRGMGGEDFSYFADLRPGCMFRLGTANKQNGIVYGLHNDRFDIDERALAIGSDMFVSFAIEYAKEKDREDEK